MSSTLGGPAPSTPDVTGHLTRAPAGEWVALTGHTCFAHAVAHGSSIALMSDVDGVFGVTSTSQLLDPRDVPGAS